MTIDPKFLKLVEDHGWTIKACDEGSCIAQCSAPGCQMSVKLVPGKWIPERFPPKGYDPDVVLTGFDDARLVLRQRREDLALNIGEVEIISGVAGDHMAKFERDNWQDSARMPNIDTFIAWAASLGFEVVLRKAALPPITRRMISETRDKYQDRRKRYRSMRLRGLRRGSEVAE